MHSGSRPAERGADASMPAVKLLCLTLAVSAALSSEPAALIDRVVAVVDDDPILLSDIERVARLGLAGSPAAGESEEAFRRRVLSQLIEERLRFHEVDRAGFAEVKVHEIEARVEEIRSRFPTEEAFRQRLDELAMTEDGLSRLVARQLAILAYVEDRLGSRVFISLDDIRRFYDAELIPALAAQRQTVPPLSEVREQIRATLFERGLNEEIERWTAELERQADIIDLFGSDHRDLPPIVEVVRPPG